MRRGGRATTLSPIEERTHRHRVERTFAFVDLCGFTALTSVHGDKDATAALAEFRRVVREVTSDHGVRVAKWLGDGAMIVGVETQPLLCAVLDIERTLAEEHAPLPLRAGLASGDVILFEGDDYIGRTVNLAARLCDEAKGHQILATPEVAAHRPDWAGCETLHGVRIRGLAEPIDVVDLSTWQHAAEVVVDPVCGMELRVDESVRGAFCSEECAGAHDRQVAEHA